jgi:hypothetical protein
MTAMKQEGRSIRVAVLLVLGLALSACATDGTFKPLADTSTPYPPSGYTHTVESSHVVLYWNCARPEASALRLEGLAFNPWSDEPVRFLTFALEGVNAEERAVSSAEGEAQDIQIRTNQSTPFQLDLRTAGSEARFDLFYEYQFQDRGHGSVVTSLDWDGPVLFAQTTQFLVRDACSDTQHLVR